MHMLLRTIWMFIKGPFLPKSNLGETTEISMRVLPIDLDLLWHVNNGVYFSFLDFGRYDAILRNGVFKTTRQKGWYSVVAGEQIKFRRSLKLWDKFTIKTRIQGYDEKAFYIHQKIEARGELMATALIKVRFLATKGGTVGTKEVLESLNVQIKNDAAELAKQWSLTEESYLKT